MRLLCPYCQESLTIPDAEAGKPVNCMYCGKQFAAPQLYAPATPAPLAEPLPTPPAPSAPPPPPPPAPEKPAPLLVPVEGRDLPAVPPPDREMSGFQNMKSVSIEPAVVRWIAPAALLIAFFLTFFSWNGMFPGGYPAYTQTAWGCMTGGVSKDEVAEDELKLATELEKRVHTNWFLFPYVILLLLALVVAWAGPVVELLKLKLPANVQNLWQYRPALLGAIAVVTLLFLSAQWASGFGLQRAVRQKVEADSAEQKAAANTPEKIQRIEMREAMNRGFYNARTTVWLRLAFLMHLLAALAVVTEAGLALRGKKPVPRVAVMW